MVDQESVEDGRRVSLYYIDKHLGDVQNSG
jgi:hypothetical protein